MAGGRKPNYHHKGANYPKRKKQKVINGKFTRGEIKILNTHMRRWVNLRKMQTNPRH